MFLVLSSHANANCGISLFSFSSFRSSDSHCFDLKSGYFSNVIGYFISVSI